MNYPNIKTVAKQAPDPDPVDPVVVDPTPEPAPDPDPDPDPDPAAEPAPDPVDPIVDPTPDPAPDPDPVADPEPVPVFDVSLETDGAIGSLDELREIAGLLKDPYFKGAVDYYKSEKTLTPYLQAHAVDFKTKNDIDILRIKFLEEYSDTDVSADVLEEIFKDEVLSKYKLDDPTKYDERDVQIGQAKAKIHADKARKQLIDAQSKFKAPVRDEPKQISPEQKAQEVAKLRKDASGLIAPVVKNGLVAIGTADGNVNIQVDPSKVIDYTVDLGKFMDGFMKDGKVDYQLWAETIAFRDQREKFLEAFIGHGKSLGKKALEDEELRNRSRTPGRSDTVIVESQHPYQNKAAFLKKAGQQIKN